MNSEERERYARHLNLAQIGEQGQKRLRAGSVCVVGAGGLGSPAALYLASAGVGTIGIVDADVVELSNLQRQVLHFTADIGQLKVKSAITKLNALNPGVRLVGYSERLSASNASRIIKDYDFILDATDNFAAKFLIAETCHNEGKPYSHAGIKAFMGQTITVHPGETACCRCVFDVLPEEPEQVPRGPLSPVPGVIGAIQAAEAIKCILGIGTPLTNALLVYDSLGMTFRRVPVKRSPECVLCGKHVASDHL